MFWNTLINTLINVMLARPYGNFLSLLEFFTCLQLRLYEIKITSNFGMGMALKIFSKL